MNNKFNSITFLKHDSTQFFFTGMRLRNTFKKVLLLSYGTLGCKCKYILTVICNKGSNSELSLRYPRIGISVGFSDEVRPKPDRLDQVFLK